MILFWLLLYRRYDSCGFTGIVLFVVFFPLTVNDVIQEAYKVCTLFEVGNDVTVCLTIPFHRRSHPF